LMDRYVAGMELEIDAVTDGTSVLIPGIMEHVERAGVHSGDSIAVFPAQTVPEAVEERAVEIAALLARALHVRGFLNVQYVYDGTRLYVLEANLRSSRTVPFVSKAVGVPLVQIATRVMLGDALADLGFPGIHRLAAPPRVAVKAPVFSMEKLGRAEAALGPEMKSTGEVMGIDADPGSAMFKAITAAGIVVRERSVLASIADRDKAQAPEVFGLFARAGFRLLATSETASLLRSAGLEVTDVSAQDAFSAEPIGLVVNTPTRGGDPSRDGFQLRRRALERRIPCLTSLDTARAVARVLTIDPALVSVEPLAGRPLE